MRRQKTIALIGHKWSGKKLALLSLFRHLFVGPPVPDVTAPHLSAPARGLFEHLRQLKQFPTPPAVPPPGPPAEHSLAFDWQGERLVVKVFPTGTVYPDGGFDPRQVSAGLAAAGVDVTVWVGNPHTLFPAVAAPTFDRMLLKTWAVGPAGQPSAFTFDDALTTAARLTFSKSSADLARLAVGPATLPTAVRQLRLTQAHRSRDLGRVLANEGASDAEVAATLRFLRLLVHSCSAECGEVNTVRELFQGQPQMLALVSHFDLSGFCGVPKSVYEDAAAALFPDDKTRMRSDLILGKSLHFELQPPPLAPVLVLDVPPDSGAQLWTALKPHLRAVAGRTVSAQAAVPAPAVVPPPPVVDTQPEPEPVHQPVAVAMAEPDIAFDRHDEPPVHLPPLPRNAPWYVRAFAWITAMWVRTAVVVGGIALLLLLTLRWCEVPLEWAEGVAVLAVAAAAVLVRVIARHPKPEPQPQREAIDLPAMFSRPVFNRQPQLNGKH